MKQPEFTKKLAPWISRRTATIRSVGKAIGRVLTLSPADDAIAGKRSLGISIERGCLCVAEGRRFFSRTKAGGMKLYPLEMNKFAEPGQLAETAVAALREFKAGNAEIHLGIPKEWAIFKSVELPASVKDTLPDVLSYEMDRLTPFTAEEALYDFAVLEENPDKVRIALAAAKAQAVNPYLKALREKGIDISAVHLNLEGLVALLAAAGHGRNSALLALLAIDEYGYEFTTVRNGCMSSAVAGRLRAENDAAIISKALREAISLCSGQENGEKPQRLFVVLSGRLADRAYPVLEKLVQTPSPVPCEVLGPSSLKPGTTGQGKSAPCAALGTVLASLQSRSLNPASMNLLSRGRHPQARYSYSLTAVLALIALAAWVFFIVAPIETEQRVLDEMNAQIAAKKPEAAKSEALQKEIEKVSRDIGFINGIKLEQPSALNIIKELTSVLPRSVWLAGMRITDSGIEIQGYATGSTTELLPLLENSSLFQKVEYASPTFRDTRTNSERFVIKMELKGTKNGNGKPEAEKKV